MLPYCRQWLGEEEAEALLAVLGSDNLTQGPRVEQFERALARQCGARHAVAVCNGTAALHLACLALGAGPGTIGVTSPISFVASANCLAYCGATPTFADIDPATLCLSPQRLEERILALPAERRRSLVVIPVDFAGVPADLPALAGLARRHGLRLIEDAAHAIGGTYRHPGGEAACGSCLHTDLAIFSFHPAKSVTTGEGGAVLTNDDELAERLRLLANHGITKDPRRLSRQPGPWYHEMVALGYNMRLTDLQCALGLVQLARLERFKARRQAIVRHYNQAFADLADRLEPPPWPENTDPCFHLYVLRLRGALAGRRAELVAHLARRGIATQVHYIPIPSQPYYRQTHGEDPDRYPQAQDYYRRALSLPLFPAMSQEQVEMVCQAVREFAEGGSR